MYNVLATEEQDGLRKAYRARLVAVTLFLLSGIFFAGSISLIPSIMQTYEKKKEYVNGLALLKKEVEGNSQIQFTETIKEVNEQVRALTLLKSDELPHETIEKVLQKRGEGITITKIGYEPVGTSSRISLEGRANRLENLLRFQEALLTIPPYTKADIPIELLSKSKTTNIRFNLDLQ